MPRPIAALPKAHLHLHFTGSMRHATLVELADEHGVHLPEALAEEWPPQLSAADERGWFRFQRLYDIARSVVRTEADLRRLILEAAQDERADGSGWLELQIDPSGYAARFGGLTTMLELVLDAAAVAARRTDVGIGIIVAANRIKHPLDARTLARLAARYAGHGVIGFGLSNDERRGTVADFSPAFRIAARAGLQSVPHGGELAGPGSVRACLDELHADRIGHGVSAAEDPDLLRRLAISRTTLEVCPTSNVALGVAATARDVPLLQLLDAGVQVALAADDPLLFGPRLAAQYELARTVHGLSDADLASLARMSVLGSAAPGGVRAGLLAGIDDWLASPAGEALQPAEDALQAADEAGHSADEAGHTRPLRSGTC
ncbi:MAG TPA: adenosine deaminase [Streptosporangiaceae bacterium]|nr:adenosine deaminase [Streptosporangiaceae bacterium]